VTGRNHPTPTWNVIKKTYSSVRHRGASKVEESPWMALKKAVRRPWKNWGPGQERGAVRGGVWDIRGTGKKAAKVRGHFDLYYKTLMAEN